MISALEGSTLLPLTVGAIFLSSIIAAVLNNIPGTMAMTHVIAGSTITGLPKEALIYSVIIGSNLGANLILIGALAGLMWIHLIRDKGYHISAWEFSKIGFLVTIPTLIVIALTLYVELLL